MPLSKGYDFIGPIINRRPLREEPVEEKVDTKDTQEAAKEEPPASEPKKEEKLSVPALEEETVDITIEESVDEPVEEEVPKKDPLYVELAYEDLQGSKPMDNLPPSKSGNYIIVYRSKTCPYCDKLLNELKDNTGDYVLVSVMCKGTVRDLFYSRWVYNWPSFIVIKDKRVTYYGYGYRTLESFKQLL